MVVTKLAARCICAILIFGVPMLSVGAAGADEAGDRAAAGAAIAKELCSGCHVVTEGQTGPVPDGVPPFSIIAAKPGRSAGYLRAYLAEPTPPMPHVPLTQQQVDSVIAYIRSFAD